LLNYLLQNQRLGYRRYKSCYVLYVTGIALELDIFDTVSTLLFCYTSHYHIPPDVVSVIRLYTNFREKSIYVHKL